MSLPDVTINLVNGALGGLLPSADGVVAIIGNGVAVTDQIQLAEPRLVNSLAEAESIGLDQANNPAAYKQLRELYAEAGDNAEVYIMLVSDAVDQATMWDNSNADGIKKLLDFANGRVRIAGSFHAPAGSYTPDTTNGLDADVAAAIINAQALAEARTNIQEPLRCLIHAYAFQGDAATVPDNTQGSQNRVGIVLGSSENDDSAGVGNYLGGLIAIPVQRKRSRVKDGDIGFANAFVNATAVEDFAALGLLHAKGYNVPRTFSVRTGYYWSGDKTCAPPTDDFNLIARGRVIDKAQLLAYGTYINELDDEVPVNDEGQLENGFVKYMEQIIKNQIDESMTAPGEISGVSVFIDPNQNVISTNLTEVELRLTPVGYQSEIVVNLGFQNPSIN